LFLVPIREVAGTSIEETATEFVASLSGRRANRSFLWPIVARRVN
jgi:hypothetical protein